MKLVKLLALAAAAGALALVVGLERPGFAHSAAGDAPGGITVTGTGTARAAPDRATISFAVTSDAATSAAATAANAPKMGKVLAALKRLGIRESDIQTDEVSVYPRYESGGERSGYTARNSASVELRGAKRAGEVVDAVTAAGATEVNGPSFERDNRGALYRAALRNAVADARSKAGALADATGVTVGRVTRIEEGQTPSYGPFPLAQRAVGAGRTPVEPGLEDVQASVTVTFAIG
jgi:uncharacterized protein